MSKVGIKDVAKKAGVSTATVSHALRNPMRVAESTREKVLAAIEEVGYTPNKLGVSLRTAKSGNIVVIIPDVADSYNFGIIKAIERVAHANGYSVLLGDTQGSELREREYAAMTRSRQADGIILLSHRFPFTIDAGDGDNTGNNNTGNSKGNNKSNKKGGKKVSIDDFPPLINGGECTGIDGVPYVAIDDVQAGIDATQHLIDLGHQHIAAITGDMNSPSSQFRLEGYHQALQRAGLANDERDVVMADYTVEAGEAAAKELLMLKERPSAIFCFSDEIALGCMHTLQTQGFNVPDDISVIGFDNIHFAKYFSPPLTTIAQPAEGIGETCALLLMDLLNNKRPAKCRHILEHRLIVRGSTKPFTG